MHLKSFFYNFIIPSFIIVFIFIILGVTFNLIVDIEMRTLNIFMNSMIYYSLLSISYLVSIYLINKFRLYKLRILNINLIISVLGISALCIMILGDSFETNYSIYAFGTIGIIKFIADLIKSTKTK